MSNKTSFEAWVKSITQSRPVLGSVRDIAGQSGEVYHGDWEQYMTLSWLGEGDAEEIRDVPIGGITIGDTPPKRVRVTVEVLE